MKKALWIDTPTALNSLKNRLTEEKIYALDIEGDYELYRYGKRICLYQFAFSDGQIYLLDALAGLDLTCLYTSLTNQNQLKIMWGAPNDVRILKSLAHCSLKGLIDLWELAKIILTPRPSLPMIAKTYLNIDIEKSAELQISDWNTRPLTSDQLFYAAQDVLYLLPLWDKMKALLRDEKNIQLFNKRLNATQDLESKIKSEPWMHLKGVLLLSPESIERLKIFYLRRDAAAKKADQAARRILSNEQLIELAKSDIPIIGEGTWTP